MEEPSRISLLSVLQKGMKIAQKKTYLHRFIYIGSYAQSSEADQTQDSRAFNILFDSNIKLINEEYCDDVITGFGLFYVGYFINIIEGPEETLVKHLKSLVYTLDENFKKNAKVEKIKVLLISHHINKRFYEAWDGRPATPPLLLDKIEQSLDIETNCRHIQNCIMKLYRISEYLKNQQQNMLKATMDNISDLCRSYLPETNLLDFLLDSPVLIDLREYIQIYGTVPEYTIYHETIWPLPSDFVPRGILNEDLTMKFMSVPEEEDFKTPEKEINEDDETEENKSDKVSKNTS